MSRRVKHFKSNLPGSKFALDFVKRHNAGLSMSFCQNTENIRAYFDDLQRSINGVRASNIVNYDGTNLTDDPGRQKLISKGGMQYPGRLIL